MSGLRDIRERTNERASIAVIQSVNNASAVVHAALEDGGYDAAIVARRDVDQIPMDGNVVIVCPQEALTHATIQSLTSAFLAQPDWSAVPFVLIVDGDRRSEEIRIKLADLFAVANIVILTRPLSNLAFRSVIRAAVEGRRRQLEIRQHLLFQQELQHELNHRVKNTFATCHAIFQISLRQSSDQHELAAKFSARLNALSKVHDLLFAAGMEMMAVGRLIESVLEPYGDARDRFEVAGPALYLDRERALSLALVINELATNAAKYGALSVPHGKLHISWSRGSDRVQLVWAERNGPAVNAPVKLGYGTRFITASLSRLSGKADYDFQPKGLIVTISAPADEFLSQDET